MSDRSQEIILFLISGIIYICTQNNHFDPTRLQNHSPLDVNEISGILAYCLQWNPEHCQPLIVAVMLSILVAASYGVPDRFLFAHIYTFIARCQVPNGSSLISRIFRGITFCSTSWKMDGDCAISIIRLCGRVPFLNPLS
jgi:hypothetical protein